MRLCFWLCLVSSFYLGNWLMLTKMSGLGLVLCTLQVSFSGVCISVAVRFSSRGYSTIYFTLMGKKCCF